MVFFIVAMVVIFIVVGLYLRSVLIMMLTLLDIIFSFGIAYFLYMVVFNLPRMPVLGMLSILLLIAISADDVFIFCDSFEQSKAANPEAGLKLWISETMRHAAVSILVTSLTTGAALYANLVSDITDIKSFGIISGTAIVTNYLLMVTWIPAGVVAIEKLNAHCCSQVQCCDCFNKFIAFLQRISRSLFYDIFPVCISKAWFVWLFLFFGLGVGGIVVTFVKPKLDLPSNQDFALFNRDHIIEVWVQDLKYKFRFFQKENERLRSGVYLIALWGVKGEDTANHFDPDSRTELTFDSFDLSQPEAQIWMRDFCQLLRNASFVDQREIEFRQCSLENFYSLTTMSCANLAATLGPLVSHLDDDCCGWNDVPSAPDVFSKCFFQYSQLLAQTGRSDHFLGTPYYEVGTQSMKAFAFQFRSNQAWTGHYQTMEAFYNNIQDWMEARLDTAPTDLNRGWLTSRFLTFDLFDLQRSLASGSYAAIGVSMAAAFLVMLVTSLNALITFYAIFTIFMTISVSAGVLVLLGWELNIVESVTLTMSVGLSIDFCIHYGMGYRLSELHLRRDRVYESFRRVGPAILMAAATTFIAGACVMPATILFYVQLGTFLMLVMVFSWLFATFFFQSLCYVVGPNGNFCQIPSPFRSCSSGYRSSTKSEEPIVDTSETQPRKSGRRVNAISPAPNEDLGFWAHHQLGSSLESGRSAVRFPVSNNINLRLTTHTFSSLGEKSHGLARHIALN